MTTIRRTLTAVALCSISAASLPAGTCAQSTEIEPRISDEAARIDAAEMGDQRQREVLRGPFRKEVDRTRDAEEPAMDGFESQDVDEYD